MIREEIMAAIKTRAEELGRVPTLAEVRRGTKLNKHMIQKHFLSYAKALAECGLRRKGPGYEADLRTLFTDWARLARKLGKLPTMAEYTKEGEYSVRPLARRYKGWTHVPAGMLDYARAEKLEAEWPDVMEMVARHLTAAAEKSRTAGYNYGTGLGWGPGAGTNAGFGSGYGMGLGLNAGPNSGTTSRTSFFGTNVFGTNVETNLGSDIETNLRPNFGPGPGRASDPGLNSGLSFEPGFGTKTGQNFEMGFGATWERSSPLWRTKVMPGQPVYGTPLLPTPLSHAPTNELGVVFLFGAVARELGFMVMRLQQEFPDCEAMREVEPGRWQRLRIEFEYESRNFVTHMHPVAECDLIVCWRHNWEGCPVEVLELGRVVRGQ